MISTLSHSPQPSGKPLGLMVNVERVSAILTLRACQKTKPSEYCREPIWADGATHRSSTTVGNCAFLRRLRLRFHTPHRHVLKPNSLLISVRVSPTYNLKLPRTTRNVVALSISPSSNSCLRYASIALKQLLWCASVA